MQRLTSHYHQRLALPSNWKVETVTLSITGKQVECPVCGQAGNIYDHTAEQRRLRACWV